MGRSAEGKKRIKPAAANEVIEQKRSLREIKFRHINEHSCNATQKVFTIEQEEELLSYILNAGQWNFGVTVDEMKKLAFQYAKFNNVKYPIQPQNVCNLDERGCSTVHKPVRVIGDIKAKQIGAATSGERRINVPMSAGVSAAGTFVSPTIIFPRVHYKEHMINNALAGTIGMATSSGWSNAELVTVIWPFNEEVSGDHEFLTMEITNRPYNVEPAKPQSSEALQLGQDIGYESRSEIPSTSVALRQAVSVTPEQICPFPKKIAKLIKNMISICTGVTVCS
ncbi:hypothetical protein ILUMI_16105 [Ignelater luminosus]|uniref:Uncharacterized protein n=1 Tax=Ignelater luminosus TaxID=2038154 RepID=A0A8K0G997_IGNLU|nr:hypothetical protein ILUMI_16105 [Ignelater luminosus]